MGTSKLSSSSVSQSQPGDKKQKVLFCGDYHKGTCDEASVTRCSQSYGLEETVGSPTHLGETVGCPTHLEETVGSPTHLGETVGSPIHLC